MKHIVITTSSYREKMKFPHIVGAESLTLTQSNA